MILIDFEEADASPFARLTSRVRDVVVSVHVPLRHDGQVPAVTIRGSDIVPQAVETLGLGEACGLELAPAGAGSWIARAAVPADGQGRDPFGLAQLEEDLGVPVIVEQVTLYKGLRRIRALVMGDATPGELASRLDGKEATSSRRVHPVCLGRGRPGEPLPAELRAVLKTALHMGYYRAPKACRLDDLARVLGLSKSSVSQRLRLIERAAMRDLAQRTHGRVSSAAPLARPPVRGTGQPLSA